MPFDVDTTESDSTLFIDDFVNWTPIPDFL